jgi:hypothetical protein
VHQRWGYVADVLSDNLKAEYLAETTQQVRSGNDAEFNTKLIDPIAERVYSRFCL